MVQYCSSGFRPSPHALDDVAAPGYQNLERAEHERDQDQEECLGGHQHRRDPRHHVAEFAPVHENHYGRIGRQQPGPQQQRAFLPAPPRRELVDRRHGCVGVRRHVAQAEIAREQRVDQDARSDGQQDPDGVDRALSADHQEGISCSLPTTEPMTAYTAKQNASRIARAPIFSIRV